MKIFIAVSIIGLTMFFISSCTTEKKPANIPVKEADTKLQSASMEPWKKTWEANLSAARKENRLVVLLTGGKELGLAWSKGFKDKFGIDIDTLAGTGSEVSQKVMAERRAGLYLADVYVGGTTTSLTSLKPAGALENLNSVLVLPEVLNESSWNRKKLEWADPDHTVLVFSLYVRNPIAINTSLVKPGEVRSLYDLLDPRWKGRISMNDPTIQGGGFSLFQVYAKHLGIEFWQKLARQEILLSRNRRQFMDWLAQGKVAITIAPNNASFAELKDAGATIEFMTPDEGTYLSSGNGSVSIFSRAPHPGAARVFINWILTQEGQTLFTRSMGVPSFRGDVPTDHLTQEMVWSKDGKYIAEDFSEESMAGKTPALELANKVFGPYVGR